MTLPTTIPYKLIAGLVGAAVLIGTFIWLIESRDHYRDLSATNEQLYLGEQAAHKLTVTNYRIKAEEARKADADHKAKVEADQITVTERTTNEYEARIAAANAQYRRLQQSANAAAGHPSGAGTAPVSIVSGRTTGPDGAAAQGQLSAPDALTATEQAIQLDELIKWVGDQGKVNRQQP